MTSDSKPTVHPPQSGEEPEFGQEESIPSDGKDEEGEKLMEELGADKPGKPLTPAGEEP